jgi:thiol-disulfide isomerase/thioredoxin
MASTTITKSIITSLTQQELALLQNEGRCVSVIKFSATWCGPCKRIQPIWDSWLKILPTNIIIAEIDIDESLELYASLKTKKMVNGVPSILAFYGDIKRDHWFIPDDSVIGANEGMVKNFLSRCLVKANVLQH